MSRNGYSEGGIFFFTVSFFYPYGTSPGVLWGSGDRLSFSFWIWTKCLTEFRRPENVYKLWQSWNEKRNKKKAKKSQKMQNNFFLHFFLKGLFHLVGCRLFPFPFLPFLSFLSFLAFFFAKILALHALKRKGDRRRTILNGFFLSLRTIFHCKLQFFFAYFFFRLCIFGPSDVQFNPPWVEKVTILSARVKKGAAENFLCFWEDQMVFIFFSVELVWVELLPVELNFFFAWIELLSTLIYLDVLHIVKSVLTQALN